MLLLHLVDIDLIGRCICFLGFGYGIVLGLGLCLGLVMMLITYIMKTYAADDTESSENYMTANRRVKTGLVASAVVSSWTWAATLLQSSSVAYSYGISGPFWYASGATIQVLLFATLAIELKRVAPNAHTFMEVIRSILIKQNNSWTFDCHLTF